MSLIQFSCVSTGPFITFKETAQRIFESIGEPFSERGAFDAKDLPGVLERLDEVVRLDKQREAELAAEREKRLRMSSYDLELTMLDQEKEEAEKNKNKEDSVRLYQRIAPLQDMIRRAIRHGKAVMWAPL